MGRRESVIRNNDKENIERTARAIRHMIHKWKDQVTKFRTLLPSIPFLLIGNKIFRSTLRWSPVG